MSMSQDMKTAEVIARLQEDLTPRELYRLHQALEDVVRDAEYPQLVVGTDEDGMVVLQDPDTGKEVSPVSVDVAYRWTYPDDIMSEEDGLNPRVLFSYDGHGDYHGFVYLSEDTMQPVRLPEGWEEETL